MILYHGSSLEVVKPDLSHSRANVDFGRGFYVTPLYEQAVKWCGKFKRRGKDGVISCYEYDESRENELKILKFESYNEEWLDFILNCRTGKNSTDYDIVVGGVANDKVFNTVELFFDGLIDKTEARNVFVMKSRTCKCVFVQRKHCHYCILKGVRYYDCESDFTSKKI